MSSIVAQYSFPPTIRSVLLKNQPDAVPPTEELDALQAELRIAKQRTLERAKKAGDDLRTIEESMRRLKEKEKGKGKAIEKIKKERACMFLPASSIHALLIVMLACIYIYYNRLTCINFPDVPTYFIILKT